MSKKAKTTEDLRDILFDEMKALREGKTTPSHATAVSKLATNIINSAALEISCARVINSTVCESLPETQISPMRLVSK